MNHRILWTLVVAGGSFAGGLAADLLFEPRRPSWRSPAPPPAAGRVRSSGPSAVVPERFDEVIRRLAPAVVAVDAVKPAAPAAEDEGEDRRRSPAPA